MKTKAIFFAFIISLIFFSCESEIFSHYLGSYFTDGGNGNLDGNPPNTQRPPNTPPSDPLPPVDFIQPDFSLVSLEGERIEKYKLIKLSETTNNALSRSNGSDSLALTGVSFESLTGDPFSCNALYTANGKVYYLSAFIGASYHPSYPNGIFFGSAVNPYGDAYAWAPYDLPVSGYVPVTVTPTGPVTTKSDWQEADASRSFTSTSVILPKTDDYSSDISFDVEKSVPVANISPPSLRYDPASTYNSNFKIYLIDGYLVSQLPTTSEVILLFSGPIGSDYLASNVIGLYTPYKYNTFPPPYLAVHSVSQTTSYFYGSISAKASYALESRDFYQYVNFTVKYPKGLSILDIEPSDIVESYEYDEEDNTLTVVFKEYDEPYLDEVISYTLKDLRTGATKKKTISIAGDDVTTD